MTPIDPTRSDALAYAAEVRRHLGDLPADELDELTGGLDADLFELAAESTTPLADRLGDPASYAAELRAAAGSAPRGRGSRLAARMRTGRARTPSAAPSAWSSGRDALREQPWWPQVRDLAVTLQPVWWVLRAWIAFTLAGMVVGARPIDILPDSAVGWVVLIAFLLLSIQLGRDTRNHLPWLRGAVLAGNVAAVALLPGVVNQLSAVRWDYETAVASSGRPGLYLDDEPVTNLFPYDADGQPLTGVQLFDAQGRPVALTERSTMTGRRWQSLVPYGDVAGRSQWNTYPLFLARMDPETGEERPGTVRAAVPPFAVATEVRPPAVSQPESTPTVSPAPTAAPTVSPVPTITPPVSPTTIGPAPTPTSG